MGWLCLKIALSGYLSNPVSFFDGIYRKYPNTAGDYCSVFRRFCGSLLRKQAFQTAYNTLKKYPVAAGVIQQNSTFFSNLAMYVHIKFAGAGIIDLRYFYGSINNVVSGMSGSGKFLTDPE